MAFPVSRLSILNFLDSQNPGIFNIGTLHFFSYTPIYTFLSVIFLQVRFQVALFIGIEQFWRTGSLFSQMGTASAGCPFGITSHSYKKTSALPHRMDCASSGFPLNVEVSRINIYPSSGSTTNSKVC